MSAAAKPQIATAAPAPSDEPLFRPEVMAERQTQWLGAVLLEPRVAHRVFAALAAASTLALIALLVFGTYTRKARINGWLVPQQGLVRMFAPQPGVVTQIHVKEGMQVAKGAPLLELSAELQSQALGATREEVVRRLRMRRDSMAAERQNQERLFEQQARDLERRLESIATELRHLGQELALQRERLALSDKALARERAMRARNLVPETRLHLAEQSRLDHAAKAQELERMQAALRREEATIAGTQHELPLRRQTQLAEIARNVAALEQELAEAEARRQVVMTAPQDGVVTAIQVEPGSNANPAVPLLSIVPVGSVLQAQLFSPSRAIGFVRPGQRVLLRYHAFAYQKFGFYEGVVSSVSRSAISPAELSQSLAGMTSLLAPTEPVYRITVELARQTATAYGEPVPLHPGMQLEADVLIETRRLIEWVFEPLFSLTGKWHG